MNIRIYRKNILKKLCILIIVATNSNNTLNKLKLTIKNNVQDKTTYNYENERNLKEQKKIDCC